MKKLIMILVLVVLAITVFLITTMTLTTDGKTNECGDSDSTWVCISYNHDTGECEKYGKKNLGCNDTFIPAII